MGLDMYLTRKVFIGAEYEHRHITGTIKLKQDGVDIPINLKRVSYIEESGIYWRKANMIHKWFVDNIQKGEDNCEEYYVPIEQLYILKDICHKIANTLSINDIYITEEDLKEDTILDKIYNDENKIEFDYKGASQLLPTQQGFFFGGYDYDRYYIYDVVYTYLELNRLLEEDKKYAINGISTSYRYNSSW